TDIKLQWRLPRLLSIDNQFCIRKDKVGDRDAHLVALAAQAAYFRTIFFRRNIHRKSAHVDRIQLHRLTKQVAQRSMEMEFRNIRRPRIDTNIDPGDLEGIVEGAPKYR